MSKGDRTAEQLKAALIPKLVTLTYIYYELSYFKIQIGLFQIELHKSFEVIDKTIIKLIDDNKIFSINNKLQ